MLYYDLTKLGYKDFNSPWLGCVDLLHGVTPLDLWKVFPDRTIDLAQNTAYEKVRATLKILHQNCNGETVFITSLERWWYAPAKLKNSSGTL